MKLGLSFAIATTAIFGISKQSFGFVARSTSRHYYSPILFHTPIRETTSLLRMSSTTTTTPDVSRFMSGERPSGTKEYVMQQTMLRVKDPMKSLEFYCDVLGFKLVMFSEFPQWDFNVYASFIIMLYLNIKTRLVVYLLFLFHCYL